MINDINSIDANDIFNVKKETFNAIALKIFAFQVKNNIVFSNYVKQRGVILQDVHSLEDIPFLPIAFFKTHKVVTFHGEPAAVFTSSGTTGMQTSSHFIKDLDWYNESLMRSFSLVYGAPEQYALLCLLPGYTDRPGSSLVYMANKIIEKSTQMHGGFYLSGTPLLADILLQREKAGLSSILLGVTHALLDFAIQYPMPLKNTLIMETGGMKGRKKEITRMEVHAILKKQFELPQIHAEYGMTELLSQAYATSDGKHMPPPWMKVMVRAADDPFLVQNVGTGLLCVVDLANVHSCSFIETSDIGKVYPDGSFEVMGRLDHADLRGCSLLIA